MATAAAAVDAAVAGDAAPKKGKKKLIIIVVAVLLVALLGGGAAVFMMKKKAAEAAAAAEEEGDGDAPAAAAEKRKDHAKHPPVFVPLEPFVVNLADKETDRFAQIGITLEVEDAKFAEEMKAYMPAIRNGILMVLSHKTSAQLLSREGKLALAREIMRESVLPLGIEVSVETEAEPAADGADEEDTPKPKKRKKKAAAVENPVKHVHFSNFIVQ
jgi:flagellar protein FliL